MRYDKKQAASFDPSAATPTSRSYQLELLEESFRRNIIIALDTGAGKTHIAVLRIKAEVLERETRKVILCPEDPDGRCD
jgi:endoribonuclease Dicer